jgi:hypothetical protein
MGYIAQRIVKIGKSLMIELPAYVVEEQGLKEGDFVRFTVRKHHPLLGAFPGLLPYEKEPPSAFSKY